MEAKKSGKRTFTGVVVSDKMDKTVTVLVTTRQLHPLYKKYITYSKKYKAHDEKNDVNEGDTVSIIENRAISKDKHWRVLTIVKRVR